MLLSDVFKTLSYGHLSNLSIGGEGSGVIPIDSQSRLTNLVNRALLELYKRFPVLEKEVIIRAYDGQTLYPLKREFADEDTTVVDHKFISDTAEFPFTEDVLKILAIYDEEGKEITLNDSGDEDSFFTPSYNTIQIPAPVTGNVYYVMYRAEPAPLDTSSPVDLTQEFELPEALHAALYAWVSYLVLAPMAGQESSLKAQERLAEYNQICNDVEGMDLVSSSIVTSTDKFSTRGFK